METDLKRPICGNCADQCCFCFCSVTLFDSILKEENILITKHNQVDVCDNQKKTSLA